MEKLRKAFASNEWNLYKYTLAQLCFLLLYSINYLVGCAWAAFVQGKSITDTSKEDASEQDLLSAWIYVAAAFICTYIFIFSVQIVRRSLFHLDFADITVFKEKPLVPDISTLQKSENKEATDNSQLPQSTVTETHLTSSPQVVASPPLPVFAPKSSLKSELLTKIPPKLSQGERKVRTLWFDKLTSNVGQAVMFLTAIAFNTAVQASFAAATTTQQVIFIWIYPFLLFCLSVPIKLGFILRLKKKQIKIKSKKTLKKLRHQLLTTRMASLKWLTNYIQGFLSNITALALTDAVLFSIQLDNLIGTAQIPATWGYSLALVCAVVYLTIQLEKVRHRILNPDLEIEAENLDLLHNTKVELINLTENVVFLMAVFSIPYSMDLTINYFGDNPSLTVLGIYAFIVTVFASFLIVWVQYRLFCSAWQQQLCNQRDLEEKSQNSSGNNSPTSATGYHKLLSYLIHENIFLHVRILLPSFTFWSEMARIMNQGMGLTVAYAWNSLIVEWLILKETEFTSWSLFGYATCITFIASISVTIFSRNEFLRNTHIRVHLPTSSQGNLNPVDQPDEPSQIETDLQEQVKAQKDSDESKREKRKASIEVDLPLAFTEGKGYGYRQDVGEV